MNSEERFKRSLEDLINSKEFPFDEANWEKASEMITASKKIRSRVIPLIITGLILLISGISGFYMLNDNESAPGTVAVKPAAEPKTALKQPSTDNPAGSLPKSGPKEQEMSVKPYAKALKSPQAAVNPAEKEIISSAHTPSKNADITVLTTDKAEAEPQRTGPAKQALQLASHSSALTTPEKENVPAPETKTMTRDIAVQAPVASQNTPAKAEPEKASGETAANASGKIPAGEHLTSDQPEPDPKTDQALNATSPGNTGTAPVTVTEPASVAMNTVAAEKEVEKTAPAAENISAVALTNEVTEKIPEIDLGEIGKPKELPTWFSVEAGASYLYGWQNPAGRDANGFNMVLGLNYFNHFASKMSLSYGIQYTATGNLGFSSHTTKVTRLNLGEESRVTVFTPTKAHYLIVPLRFNYAFNPENTIGIGCNAAYLLTVESEVEAYDQRLNTRGESEITKATGYTEGFNQFDVQGSAFYRRRLYPNLSVNAEVFYGLTDVKNNTFFNLNAFERNTGVKLTLVYNILKK